jgi:23S rRNA pseudouridine1911/1915/1917 synthase
MSSEYQLEASRDGERLDRFVSENCPGLSRTHAQKLIIDGLVTVNGQYTKAGHRLNAGDAVTVTIPPEPLPTMAPEDIPLDIIYEDADLLVVNKPAGMTVHPAPGHPGHTLANAVLAHFPKLKDEENTLRPGIVHRLDKDTSGLIIVAKNRAAQANLADQFKARTVKKSYLVLVKGRLTPETGIIEAVIGRDPRNRQRMAVVTKGREAKTAYRVVKYTGKYSLLEIKPETGRTHQIRVHLAAIGYPVVGDATYGVKNPHLSRQFLHAGKLGFNLPSTGEWVEYESPLPEDLERALREIR